MKKSKAILCILMISCLLVVNFYNFMAPSYARISSVSTWSGRIVGARETEEESEAYLVVEGGQTVLLGTINGEIQILLDIPDGGDITVEVSDDDWVWAEVQEDSGLLVIDSPLERRVEPTEPSGDEGTEENPADEGTDTPSGETGEDSTGGESTEEEPAGEEPTGGEPTEEEPAGEEPTGGEPTEEEPTEEEPTEEEPTGGEPAEGESTGGESTGEESTGGESTEGDFTGTETTPGEENGGQPTDEETDTPSGENGENQGTETPPSEGDLPEGNPEEGPAVPEVIIETRPDHVQVTITWENGEENRSATFDLAAQAYRTVRGDVTIEEGPEYYHPAIPILLQTDPESACVIQLDDGDFPALTRYSVNGEKYLLYNPDVLCLPADSLVMLDLSLTELDASEITISGKTKSTTLEYYDLPVIAVDETPIVMGSNALLIPAPYAWGEVRPDVTIERMEMTEDGLEWIRDESIECMENEETGYFQMTPFETTAGTYRVSIVWENEDTEFYRIEFPFYVFYESGVNIPDATICRYVSLA